MLDAVELAVDVDIEGGLPRPGIEGLHRPGGAGDARIVDQNVQPAEFLADRGHEFADLRLVGDVTDCGGEALDAGLGDGIGVDVGDEDGGAELLELAGDGQADAVGSGRDQDPF